MSLNLDEYRDSKGIRHPSELPEDEAMAIIAFFGGMSWSSYPNGDLESQDKHEVFEEMERRGLIVKVRETDTRTDWKAKDAATTKAQ
jgi:hypothetical protein